MALLRELPAIGGDHHRAWLAGLKSARPARGVSVTFDVPGICGAYTHEAV